MLCVTSESPSVNTVNLKVVEDVCVGGYLALIRREVVVEGAAGYGEMSLVSPRQMAYRTVRDGTRRHMNEGRGFRGRRGPEAQYVTGI